MKKNPFGGQLEDYENVCDNIIGKRLSGLVGDERETQLRKQPSHTNSSSLTSAELTFTRHPGDECLWSCLQREGERKGS